MQTFANFLANIFSTHSTSIFPTNSSALLAKSVTLPPIETSVELKPPFDYSPWFLIITALVIAIIIILEIIFAVRKKSKTTNLETLKVVVPPRKTLENIKQEYLAKLANLEQNLPNLTIRKSYQSLSEIIRLFVFEATGLQVQNCSLQEISTLNIPALTSLVAEYYNPEFAFESKGDIRASLEKSKQLIWYWS